VQRRQRQAVPLATIALVGYTNAGKSTLFNRLTGAGVLADARMFATLDPTVRQLTLPSRRRVLVSDTVGFISNLPATLVKAFRATLEEVTEASLLLHLVDSSTPAALHYIAQVDRTLAEIGAAAPQLRVLNKCDLLADSGAATGAGGVRSVSISALAGVGIDALLAAIDQMLPTDPLTRAAFRLPAGAGAAIHALHEFGRVLETRYEQDDCVLVAEVPESLKRRLRKYLEA